MSYYCLMMHVSHASLFLFFQLRGLFLRKNEKNTVTIMHDSNSIANQAQNLIYLKFTNKKRKARTLSKSH